MIRVREKEREKANGEREKDRVKAYDEGERKIERKQIMRERER